MLSLLVPVYNGEKYILPFLSNISALLKPFDEILFYDDASTDNSVQILKENQQTVIIGKENRGAGYARNKLALHSRNDWFHFHDIDDLLNPEYVQEVLAVITETKIQADIIISNVDWFDENGDMVSKWEYRNAEIKKNPVAYTILHSIGGINGLYKKDAFNKIGGFRTDLKIWEDADLHVRLAMAGNRFHIIEKTLSISIRRENSLSNNQQLGWAIRLRVLESYQKYVNELEVMQAIGLEAQKAASALMIFKDFKSARIALELSETCKIKTPISKNFFWQIAKLILPSSIRIKLRIMQLKHSFSDRR